MIKYYATAAALRAASCCGPARLAYRAVGNVWGGRNRSKGTMPDYYLRRVERNLANNRLFALAPDDYVLELGTGWMHWEAITLRLFHTFKAVLYDVWDNRQLSGLKNYLRQLDKALEDPRYLPGVKRDIPRTRIAIMLGASNFEEIYRRFGFEYVVDTGGVMRHLPSQRFAAVISAGVMEHVDGPTADVLLHHMHRILRPGGWAAHSITLADHHFHYDRTMHPKQYLAHSGSTWSWLLDNGVQRINQIPKSRWLTLFKQAGLTIHQTRDTQGPAIKPHADYAHQPDDDLRCTWLDVVSQRPVVP